MALVAPPLGSAQLTVLHLHTYTWKINILNPKKITPFFPKENHLPNLQYCLVCSMFEISGVYGGNFYKKRVVCQTICGCPSTERQGFYFFCNEHFQSFLATHMFSLKMCFFGNKAFSPVLSWDLQIFHFFVLLTFLRDVWSSEKIRRKIVATFLDGIWDQWSSHHVNFTHPFDQQFRSGLRNQSPNGSHYPSNFCVEVEIWKHQVSVFIFFSAIHSNVMASGSQKTCEVFNGEYEHLIICFKPES